MSKRKPTIRRTNSAETFPDIEHYNTERNTLGLPGHHNLSVLAETPSYTIPLNDLIPSNSGKKDDLQYHRKELASLKEELNRQRQAEMPQMLQSSTRNRKPVENELDAKSHGSRYAPIPIRIKTPPSILNIPRPGESKQTEKYDREGLPPPPSLKKSSSRKSKKEPSAFKMLTIPKRQPYSSATQTFMETRKIKPKSKSKGGKNKTKKRKAKKNKKTKK